MKDSYGDWCAQTTAAQTTFGTPPVTWTYTGAVTTLDNHTGEGMLNAPVQLDAPTLVAGITEGSDGKLFPTATTTRAEMAQVLYNLLGK